MPLHGAQGTRRFQAEGNRQRLLHPRASGHRRALVFSGEARQRVRQPGEVGLDQFEGRTKLQHQPGIHRVLAGCTPVDVAGRALVLPSDQGGQRLYHRDGRIAGGRGLAAQRGQVEQFRTALRRDRRRRRFRNHAQSRLGTRERGFEIEHALQVAAIGKYLAHRFGAQQRVEKPGHVSSRRKQFRCRLAGSHSTPDPRPPCARSAWSGVPRGQASAPGRPH